MIPHEQTSIFLSTRGFISRRDIKHVEDGRLCSSGRQLHLPLGGQTRICPHGRRCQLSDLGLPLSLGCTQGYRLRAYWGSAHLQERQEKCYLVNFTLQKMPISMCLHEVHQVQLPLIACLTLFIASYNLGEKNSLVNFALLVLIMFHLPTWREWD